jgi:hypothetical protein
MTIPSPEKVGELVERLSGFIDWLSENTVPTVIPREALQALLASEEARERAEAEAASWRESQNVCVKQANITIDALREQLALAQEGCLGAADLKARAEAAEAKVAALTAALQFIADGAAAPAAYAQRVLSPNPEPGRSKPAAENDHE